MNRIFYIAFFSLLLFSCGRDEEPKKEPVAEKPAAAETAPKIELLPTTFGALGNWKHDNLSQAVRAFADSCAKISGEKNQYLSNAAIKIPTADYQAVCRDFAARDIHTSADFRRFVENNFIPNLVVENGNEIGKFTSYYESSLNASYHKNDRYKYPIYGRPNDLIEFNLRDFDENQAPKRYVGRIAGQKLVPYYTRRKLKPVRAMLRCCCGVTIRLTFTLCRFRARRWPTLITAAKCVSAMRTTTAAFMA